MRFTKKDGTTFNFRFPVSHQRMRSPLSTLIMFKLMDEDEDPVDSPINARSGIFLSATTAQQDSNANRDEHHHMTTEAFKRNDQRTDRLERFSTILTAQPHAGDVFTTTQKGVDGTCDQPSSMEAEESDCVDQSTNVAERLEMIDDHLQPVDRSQESEVEVQVSQDVPSAVEHANHGSTIPTSGADADLDKRMAEMRMDMQEHKKRRRLSIAEDTSTASVERDADDQALQDYLAEIGTTLEPTESALNAQGKRSRGAQAQEPGQATMTRILELLEHTMRDIDTMKQLRAREREDCSGGDEW